MEHDMTQYVETEIKAITPKLAAVYVAPVRAETDHLPILDLDTLPRNTFWLTLGRALTLKRDYGSQTEAAYVAWLCNRLPVTMIDGAGNIHVDTRSEPAHRSMFTSHTDTVHSGGGINTVRVDGKFWRADKGSALGADDGAGNAIMAYMIEMGVPGYYVFFRGEECGGVGSKWLSEEMPELFDDIDRAVAFDRAGYYDIITHQSGGRCSSDEFAQALADKLSTDESWFVPCNGGVYTDTAEFIELIPECTNISVGYKNQHGDREEQDVEFLWKLAVGCVSVQWDNLVTKRDPKVRESRYDEYAEWMSYYSKGSKNDGVYYGTSMKDDIDVKEYGIEDDEAIVMDAIDAALYGNDKQWLIDLIADAVYPDDPGLAIHHIRASKLDEETLMIALDMLSNGWQSDQVLVELYDLVSTTR